MDSAWIAKFRMPQSVRCFQQPLHLQAKVTLPRSYIQCMRYADQGPFGQFAARAKRDAEAVAREVACGLPQPTGGKKEYKDEVFTLTFMDKMETLR